jgi:hypothetical protein
MVRGLFFVCISPVLARVHFQPPVRVQICWAYCETFSAIAPEKARNRLGVPEAIWWSRECLGAGPGVRVAFLPFFEERRTTQRQRATSCAVTTVFAGSGH